MRFRDQRALTLDEDRRARESCPAERPPRLVECPRGCGLKYLAAGQRMTMNQFWRYGPWRMAVHLATPGRCARPLFDGPVQLTAPKSDDVDADSADTTTTEESEHHNGNT